MMPVEHEKVIEIVGRALDFTGEARARFLKSKNADQGPLGEAVASLLDHEDHAAFLEEPLCPPDESEDALFESFGVPAELSRLGAYRLLGEIGRGGMGSVYSAVRDDEVFQRRVAVKILHAGMATPHLVRGFQRERRILGRLDHPNIARILDGGATPDGRPYYVMEFVEGEPLLEFCAKNRLSVQARIRLFQKICDAVQFAHRNLVIHRDLKPGNILVDTAGEPKLIDFGIAGFLKEGLAEEYGYTLDPYRFFTPDYASPEQWAGRPMTTATDIFSLGVVFCECLTGSRPFRRTGELGRMGRSVSKPAPLPSSLVASDNEPGFLEEPMRRRRVLRGDLDKIILTALQQEPDERYGSVQALSEDLDRHLSGFPVLARGVSWSYVFRKWMLRHWRATTMALLIVCLVLGFTFKITVQKRQVENERDTARRTVDFMVELFELADPESIDGNGVTARTLLDQAAKNIRSGPETDPLVRATLLDTMGRVYTKLGLYGESEKFLAEAQQLRAEHLGTGHPDYALSLANRGELSLHLGSHAEAERLLGQALSMLRARNGHEDAVVLKLQGLLAISLGMQGRFAKAEPFFRDSLDGLSRKLGPYHPEVGDALNNLGICLNEQGRWTEALEYLERALAVQEHALGPNHYLVATTLNNLALTMRRLGQPKKAAELLERSLILTAKETGKDHADYATTLCNLASVNHDLGKLDRSEALYLETLHIEKRVLGSNHPSYATTKEKFAGLLLERNKAAEAEQCIQEALAIRHERLDPTHPDQASGLLVLARIRLARNDPETARTAADRSLSLFKAALGDKHPKTIEVRNFLESLAPPTPVR